MKTYKSRLTKLEKETSDDDLIIKIEYVRDWRSDRPQDIAEMRYIRPGRGFVEVNQV